MAKAKWYIFCVLGGVALGFIAFYFLSGYAGFGSIGAAQAFIRRAESDNNTIKAELRKQTESIKSAYLELEKKGIALESEGARLADGEARNREEAARIITDRSILDREIELNKADRARNIEEARRIELEGELNKRTTESLARREEESRARESRNNDTEKRLSDEYRSLELAREELAREGESNKRARELIEADARINNSQRAELEAKRVGLSIKAEQLTRERKEFDSGKRILEIARSIDIDDSASIDRLASLIDESLRIFEASESGKMVLSWGNRYPAIRADLLLDNWQKSFFLLR